MMYLKTAFTFGAIIVILFLIVLWQGAADNVSRLEREVKIANAAIADRDMRINDLEVQATEKLADDTAITKAKEELHDAIKDIPAGVAPSPASVALGCARLRQAGATSPAFKRVCGNR